MHGGELLKKWRGERTQTVAAAMLELPQSSVSDYEGGKVTPRIDHILKIAEVTEGFVPAESWAKASAQKSGASKKKRRGRRPDRKAA